MTSASSKYMHTTGKEFHRKLHYEQGIQCILHNVHRGCQRPLPVNNDYALHCTTGKEFHITVLLLTNNDPYPSPTITLLARNSI